MLVRAHPQTNQATTQPTHYLQSQQLLQQILRDREQRSFDCHVAPPRPDRANLANHSLQNTHSTRNNFQTGGRFERVESGRSKLQSTALGLVGFRRMSIRTTCPLPFDTLLSWTQMVNHACSTGRHLKEPVHARDGAQRRLFNGRLHWDHGYARQ